MAFDAASTVLQEREDICLPVEYLTELIQEDRCASPYQMLRYRAYGV